MAEIGKGEAHGLEDMVKSKQGLRPKHGNLVLLSMALSGIPAALEFCLSILVNVNLLCHDWIRILPSSMLG
jgi:hypothetical protein